MAADLLTEGKDGKDFMEKLRSSLMIEIKCRDSSNKLVTVRIPEALACSISGRLSTLLGTGTQKRREISVEQLLGGPDLVAELEDLFTFGSNATILDYLTWFVQWLYTSKLNYNIKLRFFEMWIFASKIGCPLLQNEAVRMLSRDASWRSNVSLEEKKLQYYFANSKFFECFMYCVEPFMFSEAIHSDGFDKDGKLEASFWDNRKCWLFLLDCAAYFGPGDRRVRNVFGEEENLDIQIIKRMVDLAKGGGDACPWEPKNVIRYFVTEHVRDGGLHRAGLNLAPARKHAPSPGNSDESKKRPKVSLTPEQLEAMIEISRVSVGEKKEGIESEANRPLYPEPPSSSSQDGSA